MITQDSILELIRKQEADIQTLLETKKKTDDETTFIVTERVALVKQEIIHELRGLL